MAENGFAVVRGLIDDDLIAQVIEETFIELSDGIRKQDLWKSMTDRGNWQHSMP
jgi:hypothetical protein